MASRFLRAVTTARLQPVPGLLPRAYTSILRRLPPLHVGALAFFSTKPDPNDPTASLLPAAATMTNTEAARTVPQDKRQPIPPLVESPLGDAHTIKDALELYRLPCWGFVLFRCTYRSQEKWDRFAALVQGHAREKFEQAGLMDVYARMRWTVFEDAAALDGASIVETSRRFVEWLERGPGGEELAGSVFAPTMEGTDTPRHMFFLHVDEESLESLVGDDARAREEGDYFKEGYFCTMVRPDNVVLNGIESPEKGLYLYEGREMEEDEVWDLSKRVKIDDLVSLYAGFHFSPDIWYCLSSYRDNIFRP